MLAPLVNHALPLIPDSLRVTEESGPNAAHRELPPDHAETRGEHAQRHGEAGDQGPAALMLAAIDVKPHLPLFSLG